MPASVLKDYWVLENDPEKLAENIWERIRRHYQSVQQAIHWHRIFRSWLYYHGFWVDPGMEFSPGAVIEITDGQIIAGVNDYRALIDAYVSFATQTRTAYQARAKQSDHASLQQADLGKNVLDHYRFEKEMEASIDRATLHAMVMSRGFLHIPWDRSAGEILPVLDGVPDENVIGMDGAPAVNFRFEPQGDFTFENPTVWDVVTDPGVRQRNRLRWIAVRAYENKWDLAATVPRRLARRILDEPYKDEEDEALTLWDWSLFAQEQDVEGFDSTDVIPVWYFYHLESPACPEGRLFKFAAGGVPLIKPQACPYYRFPLFSIEPGEMLGTQYGHTPAFDLQGPQELQNAEVSVIASHHRATSYVGIWAPDQAEVERDEFGGAGTFFIRGGQIAPQGISFTANSPDHERFANQMSKAMERLSGINAAARGEPPSQVESGEAMKVLDAKAHQAAFKLKLSRIRAIENSGTFIVRTLRDLVPEDEERLIAIAGEANRDKLRYFKPEDLRGVDRFVAEVGNPVMDTVSGRMWAAEMLIQTGMVSTPQEFLTVLQTGQLEPLVRSLEGQIDLTHEENEALSRGETIEIDRWTDNHVFHLREHATVLSSPLARRNPQIASATLGHMALHLQAAANPLVQYVQGLLGYPTGPLLLPPGMGGGAGPQDQGQESGGGKPPGGPSPRNIAGPSEPSPSGPGGSMRRYPKAM